MRGLVEGEEVLTPLGIEASRRFQPVLFLKNQESIYKSGCLDWKTISPHMGEKPIYLQPCRVFI